MKTLIKNLKFKIQHSKLFLLLPFLLLPDAFLQAQSISIGPSPSGNAFQLSVDIKQHFEVIAGYHTSWASKVPVYAIGLTYKFKPVKTWYFTITDIVNFMRKTSIDQSGNETHSYYDAAALTAGYQFNFGKYKRFDLRLGLGIRIMPGYKNPYASTSEVVFGFHFKKYKAPKDMTIGMPRF